MKKKGGMFQFGTWISTRERMFFGEFALHDAGPQFGRMHYAQNLDVGFDDAVDQEIGQLRMDQFAGSRYEAFSSRMRESAENVCRSIESGNKFFADFSCALFLKIMQEFEQIIHSGLRPFNQGPHPPLAGWSSLRHETGSNRRPQRRCPSAPRRNTRSDIRDNGPQRP